MFIILWFLITVCTAEFSIPLDLRQRSISSEYQEINTDNLPPGYYPWRTCFFPKKSPSIKRSYSPLDEGGFIVVAKSATEGIDFFFVSSYGTPAYIPLSDLTTGDILPSTEFPNVCHLVYSSQFGARYVVLLRDTNYQIEIYALSVDNRVWFNLTLTQHVDYGNFLRPLIAIGESVISDYIDLTGNYSFLKFQRLDFDFAAKQAFPSLLNTTVKFNTVTDSLKLITAYQDESNLVILTSNGSMYVLNVWKCDSLAASVKNISCQLWNSDPGINSGRGQVLQVSTTTQPLVFVYGSAFQLILETFMTGDYYSSYVLDGNDWFVPKYVQGADFVATSLGIGYQDGEVSIFSTSIIVGSTDISSSAGFSVRAKLVGWLDGSADVVLLNNRPQVTTAFTLSLATTSHAAQLIPMSPQTSSVDQSTVNTAVAVIMVLLIFIVLVLSYAFWDHIVRRSKVIFEKFEPKAETSVSHSRHGREGSSYSKPEITHHSVSNISNSTMMTFGKTLALPGFLMVINEQDLSLDKKIAEGGGGVIYFVKLMNNHMIERGGGNIGVAKVLKREGFVDEDDLTLAFNQEISVMWLMNNSEYVVRLLGYCQSPKMILMKYYQYGSLYELIHRKTNHVPDNKWNPKFILLLAYDIAHGLMDMHEAGLVHCDIKPGNIFLDKNQDGTMKAIVGDVGVACTVDENLLRVKAFRESRVRGASVAYSAPEVLRAFRNNDDADLLDPFIAKSSDVYSYSMMLHEALTRRLVWDRMKNDDIERLVLSGQRPRIPKPFQERRERDNILDLLCQIMTASWAPLPKDRPTFSQIVKDIGKQKSKLNIGTLTKRGNRTKFTASLKHQLVDLKNVFPAALQNLLKEDCVFDYNAPVHNFNSFVPKVTKVNEGNLLLSVSSPVRSLVVESLHIFNKLLNNGRLLVVTSEESVYHWTEELKSFGLKEENFASHYDGYAFDFVGVELKDDLIKKIVDKFGCSAIVGSEKKKKIFLVDHESWQTNWFTFQVFIKILCPSLLTEKELNERYVLKKDNTFEVGWLLNRTCFVHVDEAFTETAELSLKHPTRWVPMTNTPLRNPSKSFSKDYTRSSANMKETKKGPLKSLINAAKLDGVLSYIKSLTSFKYVPTKDNKLILVAEDPVLVLTLAEHFKESFDVAVNSKWDLPAREDVEHPSIILTNLNDNSVLTPAKCINCLTIIVEMCLDFDLLHETVNALLIIKRFV